MGKIRVKTLGDESLEQKQKQKARLASEAKRAHKKAEQKKLVKGTKHGERIIAVGPSEEELAKLEVSRVQKVPQVSRGETPRGTPKRSRSKSYQAVAKTLDKSKKYSLPEALVVLEKLKRSKFDETVELHINTVETGLSGNTTLPYGTGKTIRVAIANDSVLAKVAMNKIDFDILLAAPVMMPKLAKVAKILGPKGLMPNPKNGTLTKDPQTLALSFAKGLVNFRTELKAPIMHLTVGKMSYGAKKLSENIGALIDAIKKEKIRNMTLKSTMSPGIKIQL